MKLIKSLKHAINMVIHSKLRSWLTIIGIVIGVGAVIAIMSISEGMEQSLNEQMWDLGGDTITITAGFSRPESFGPGKNSEPNSVGVATEDEVVIDKLDYQSLRVISNIEYIDRNIKDNVEVSYLGKSGDVSLTGVDQKVWSYVNDNLELSDGRFLDSADQNVIVIGGKLANDYFDQPLGINKMISIENSAYRIVGILDDTSSNIYMPLQMAYQITDKENDIYDSIIIKVKNEELVDETIENIESKLRTLRHVTEKDQDFTISSSKEMLEMRSEMMSSMSSFLLAIAAVSLIVGSVGIANTMFTSVIEKTKEIGIMKAIGARNKDIMMIFILHSVLIGIIGGILGIILGSLLSLSMSLFMPTLRMFSSSIISLDSILISMSVSVIVGLVAGIVPAYNASKLKPVDALRSE